MEHTNGIVGVLGSSVELVRVAQEILGELGAMEVDAFEVWGDLYYHLWVIVGLNEAATEVIQAAKDGMDYIVTHELYSMEEDTGVPGYCL